MSDTRSPQAKRAGSRAVFYRGVAEIRWSGSVPVYSPLASMDTDLR